MIPKLSIPKSRPRFSIHLIRSSFALLATISLSSAQTINISGTVTDTAGTALSGANVTLEKGKQTAITDADGRFVLSGTIGIAIPINRPLRQPVSIILRNGLLTIEVAARTAIKIVSYTLQGRVIASMERTIEPGTHVMEVPKRGSGVYLFKVHAGKSELVSLCSSIDGKLSSPAHSFQPSLPSIPEKESKVAVVINDIIAVTKDGYLNYRVVVYNADTSGIAIKMIANAGSITDADGNVYQTVKIGKQEWMAENLRTTKYIDGTPIPLDTSLKTWDNATTPKFCYYGNTANADSIRKFGALYNGYVVDTANVNKIAPPGWHLPDDEEWDTLTYYLIAKGYNWDGTTTGEKMAKSLAAKADWQTSKLTGAIGADLTKNNASGFSALPGGRRNQGIFVNIGDYGFWWSATKAGVSVAQDRVLGYDDADIFRSLTGYYNRGHSVRFIRD